MTKKDFIRILIKLIGIYMLFSSLPTFLAVPIALNDQESLEILFSAVAIIIGIIAFSSWLIFFPDSLISLLRLAKGFDDNQIKPDQLKGENLTSFAVLIIGGILLVHSFTPFVVELFQRIHYAVSTNSSFSEIFETFDNTRLYTYILEVFIGCFLISNYPKFARFLAKKNKNKESE